MRYPVHIDWWWLPVLVPMGVTRANAYVAVTDKEIEFHFGPLFRYRFPRGQVAGARLRSWPLWYGIGWRTNLRGAVGLVGSYQGIVEVRLKDRQRLVGLLPLERIAVSLENPDKFLAAVKEGPASGGTPAPKGEARTRAHRSNRRPRGRRAPDA